MLAVCANIEKILDDRVILCYYIFNMPLLELRKSDYEDIARRKKDLLLRTKEACKLLQAFGASAVYLFGSILREDFGRHSDVDIAVSGLPEDRLYTVEGYVEEILCTDRFDLAACRNILLPKPLSFPVK